MSASIWVGYPRSYTKGRARPIQYVTLHYTAGSEGPSSAENGAAYDKRRTDGTSTHYFTDSEGKALQEVPDGDRAHAARWHGNEVGVHIEICGTRQTRAQWLDPVSLATLRTTATLVAELCERHNLPKKRLSVAQTRAAYYASPSKRPKGINDHWACTLAYPEDGGDHTDVGPEFPWDVFMDLVEEAGDDMPTVDEIVAALAKSKVFLDAVSDAVWLKSDKIPAPREPYNNPDLATNPTWGPQNTLRELVEDGRRHHEEEMRAIAALSGGTPGGEYEASGSITLTPKADPPPVPPGT